MSFFGKDHTLFRLFGLPIKANVSWLFLVALIMFSLAEFWFPDQFYRAHVEGTQTTYWALALIGTVGLFASLIIHEMCHSLVARSTGMPVAGITLFIFGGVSQLQDEPPTAGAEFFMAVVGPLSSVLIGGVMFVAYLIGKHAHWGIAAESVVLYLAVINVILAAFNSLPAFPLDGGRVLRSIVWGISGDLQVATQVAVTIGSGLGFLMIFAGLALMFMVRGEFLGGLWLLVIGFFVRQAALSNLQMVQMREYLEGETVRRFMTTDVVTVHRDLNLQRFVDELVFHHRFNYYPVVDEAGALIGVVSARAPRQVGQHEWGVTSVGDVMQALDESMTIGPDDDAVEALGSLRRREESRLVVVENGRPIGIVSLRDLLSFLALKIDLEPRRVSYRG
jgi:Zn-dependent protease/CBS domain-containing protein